MDNLTTGENSESFGEVVERETVSENETSDDVGTYEETTEEPEKVEETQPAQEPEVATQEPTLTEKGTKLDENPLSAAHQQLANERNVRGQYEQVLGNPQMLAQYMKQQYGIDVQQPQASQQPATEQPQTKQYKAEDFQNLEDVASVVNSLQSSFAEKSQSYEKEIQDLKQTVTGLATSSRNAQIAQTTEQGVSTLRTLPELVKGSPEYIEGLEDDIVSEYMRTDFDQQSKTFRGNASIEEIGKLMVERARKYRQAGSIKAQTIVKERSEGRVKVSPTVNDRADTAKMSAADSIAAGVAKMFNGK